MQWNHISGCATTSRISNWVILMMVSMNPFVVWACICPLSVFFTGNVIALGGAEKLIAKKAAVMMSMHKKAKKALVNSAQDKLFRQYFNTEDSSHRSNLKDKIDHISLKVQSNFHVSEMCLIDPKGNEISRIVGKEIAHDLSNEESSASFFKPGFEQKPRTAYISPPYLSMDVNRWVLAYVTPVVVEGQVVAILHYEHGLDVFQLALNKGFEGENQFIVAVNDAGRVVSDSRVTIDIDKQGENESPEHYFKEFNFNGRNLSELLETIDGGKQLEADDGSLFDAAYRKVPHWTLLVFNRTHN